MRPWLAVGVAFLGVLLLALGVAAFAGQADAQAQFPDAKGQAVADYILKQNPYTKWGTWPADGVNDFTQFLVSSEPHGSVVKIYVNDVALSAAKNFTGQLPDHSIIVKENYMGTDPKNPGQLAALTVMYKSKGFDPTNKDWFWLKAAPDGKVDLEGKVGMCIGCHSQPGNHDFVLRYGFGEKAAVTSLRSIAAPAAGAAPAPAAQPATLPKTGGNDRDPSPAFLVVAGLLLVLGGLGVWRQARALR